MKYTVKNTVDIGKPVDVFLNGEKIDNVLMADDEKGELYFYPSPLEIDNESKTIVGKTLYGKVEVRLREA